MLWLHIDPWQIMKQEIQEERVGMKTVTECEQQFRCVMMPFDQTNTIKAFFSQDI